MLKYIWLWFPMLVIAILNGMLREFFLLKAMSSSPAHQLSTITLLLFFAIYIFLLSLKFPLSSAHRAWQVGLMWMAMTLVFEFGFGALRGRTLQEMIGDYNIIKGKIWVLIPIWVAVAPRIFWRARK